MSIVFRLESSDVLYDEVVTDKYILNDIDGSTKESKRKIDDLLIRDHLGDNLSLIPTCICGHYTGTFHVGIICEKCSTPVEAQLDEKLAYLLWIRQPMGVSKLIAPYILNILANRYSVSSPKVSLVAWMITSKTQTPLRLPNPKIEAFWNQLKAKNIPLGYNGFINNFRDVIEILERGFSSAKNKNEREEFLKFIDANMEHMFSKYIAIPNRTIFMFETNEVGKFVDKDLLDAISVVRSMTSIDILDLSNNVKQAKTAVALLDYGAFFEGYNKETFFGKNGLIRKNLSRARSPFTIRAVVVSRTGHHHPREIELPWSATCSLLQEHIMGALFQKGMSIKQAKQHHYHHIKKYDPLIHSIMNMVIETAGGGLPFKLVRNPSLGTESIQFVRGVLVKTDPRDNTMGVSFGLSKVFNMDYDGDMLNAQLLLTREMIEAADALLFHNDILDLSSPNKFGHALASPKTINTTVANWLER